MKKVVVCVLCAIMVTVMFVITGCSDNSEQIAQLQQRNIELEQRIEELERKDISADPKDLSVFWTDKAEYVEGETVTVYFGENAVYKVVVEQYNVGLDVFSIQLQVTSLICPISKASILLYSYIVWDAGQIVNATDYGVGICNLNVVTRTGCDFRNAAAALENATFFDLVLCVPGVPFPLCTIKNLDIRGA